VHGCERTPPATPSLNGGRPPIEVADVFRAYGETFRQRHALTPDQGKVMRAIETCRTEVLGGHVDVCPACGYSRPAYNSCRNRHCPKCQFLTQAKWVEERMARILPVSYFHVVFTLPAALRPLVRRNPRRLYDLLFDTVSQTLLALGRDPKRLGAQLGFTAVLHTWTRSLEYHPHIHCIVTAGGLSADGQSWVRAGRGRYLFPVKVMGALFRGKFLAGLVRLRKRGELDFGGDHPAAFAPFVDGLYRQAWVVYAKRPFGGPDHVYQYLGRYTHRIAISNQRLIAFDDDGVRFHTRGDNTLTLSPEEFIRRFLAHVLPHGFAKIRHFGLLAPCHAKTRLERARQLLRPEEPPPTVEKRTWVDRLLVLTGVDPTRCPRCGTPLIAVSLDLWSPGYQPTPIAYNTS
jgi:Putative transposase/Transposase zinc-binding domain